MLPLPGWLCLFSYVSSVGGVDRLWLWAVFLSAWNSIAVRVSWSRAPELTYSGQREKAGLPTSRGMGWAWDEPLWVIIGIPEPVQLESSRFLLMFWGLKKTEVIYLATLLVMKGKRIVVYLSFASFWMKGETKCFSFSWWWTELSNWITQLFRGWGNIWVHL